MGIRPFNYSDLYDLYDKREILNICIIEILNEMYAMNVQHDFFTRPIPFRCEKINMIFFLNDAFPFGVTGSHGRFSYNSFFPRFSSGLRNYLPLVRWTTSHLTADFPTLSFSRFSWILRKYLPLFRWTNSHINI